MMYPFDLTVNFITMLLLSSLAIFVVRVSLRKMLFYGRLKKKHTQLATSRAFFHQLFAEKKHMIKDLDVPGILRKKAHELHRDIKEGKFTCQQVLTVFQSRCEEIERQNFLAEYLETADELAEKLDMSKETIDSPIFGIPVSLKECIFVKGKDATCGLVKGCFKPMREHSVIYQVLCHRGAIPFITTSMARAGLAHDSSNPIFGQQHNPTFPKFSAGGSSGGEAIALSQNASPLGVGTDIGGSVRFPPAFNGICGLNPTKRRISCKGVANPGKIPRIDLRISLGPMARCVEDLADFMRAVICDKMFELDPTCLPSSFDEEAYRSEKPLKIGYYTAFQKDKQMAMPVPSVMRAVRKAVDVLRAKGHFVTEMEFPDPDEAFLITMSALMHDGGAGLVCALTDEPLPLHTELSLLFLQCPRFVKPLFGKLAHARFGPPARQLQQSLNGLASSVEAAELLRAIENFRYKFLHATREFDAIVCPLFPVPVPKKCTHDVYNNASSSYSIVYNMLNQPAGALCVDRVTSADNAEAKLVAKTLRSEGDRFNAHLHESQDEENLPLNVQVVGRPFHEELVLRVMKEIEVGVQFDYNAKF